MHRPETTPRWNALELWHLLSLDAPAVAALWTAFFARCTGARLPWSEPVAMFVAVWLLYAADRLLDARPLPTGASPDGLEERHRFHQRHRKRFLLGIGAAAGLLIGLLTRMDAETLRWETVLAMALGLWLLLIHIGSSRRAEGDRLPKEFAVGVFFTAATVIPAALRAAQPWTLAPSALLFAAVCALNCVLLYRWEHPLGDRYRPVPRPGHPSTRWAAARTLPLGAALLALGCAALLTAPRAPVLACLLSTVCLLGLDWLQGHRRVRRVTLRALADLVLLTPLLVWPLILRSLPAGRWW